MEKRRVVITGLGAVTPIGNTAADSWAAAKAGKCGIAPITRFDTEGFKVKLAAEVKDLVVEDHLDKREAKKMARFTQLALIAAAEAFADSGLDMAKEDADRCGVILSSGIGGLDVIESETRKALTKGFDRISPFFIPMVIPNMAAGRAAIQFGLKGLCSCVVTACAGGSNAVGSAGYLAMVPELLAQADSLPVPPARLVCTMGSLGTFAGLWLGARAFGAPFSVTGVAVNPATGYTREKAAALVNEMSAAYGLDIAAAPEDMDIIYADAAHDYAGPGYNVPDAKTRGAVELLARTEGIFLDPCYTAKSFRGFCDIARELDGGAIFVHTGGTPALWTQEHLDAFAADYWN